MPTVTYFSMLSSHCLTTLVLLLLLPACSCAQLVGINYGTVADNLPPASEVAAFIRHHTTIKYVKIFDANPATIKAFAHTNISLTITVPDDAIFPLSKPQAARSWISTHVLPFFPATTIRRIALGNEILATRNKSIIAHLLPAMTSIHAALQSAGIAHRIQVSSPHSLGKIITSGPPSSGRFRYGYDRIIFGPILEFHRRTKSPFMICPYPYFGSATKALDYALFRPNGGVLDNATGLNYTNMFDAQVDAVYSAMKSIGYGDVDIVVAETGWPSAGDPDQPEANVQNAQAYNSNVLKHVTSGIGTPLMPNRTFETYIFSLFNENLKPNTQERNFGLFRPDLVPVYDIGLLRHPKVREASSNEDCGKKWCGNASDAALQANCKGGGVCFQPDNVSSYSNSYGYILWDFAYCS